MSLFPLAEIEIMIPSGPRLCKPITIRTKIGGDQIRLPISSIHPCSLPGIYALMTAGIGVKIKVGIEAIITGGTGATITTNIPPPLGR
jgi:hypothetical protein